MVMKRVIVFTFAVLCGYQLMAAEGINSRVIHDYTEIGVGYEYIDVEGGAEAHGAIAHTSVDMDNVILDINGGYVWGDDADSWRAGAGLGYAVRLMRNRINIIPRVGITYNKFDPDGVGSSDLTTVEPGVVVSYAINNRLSINAGYEYVHDIDFNKDEELHLFGIGARIAVRERMGVDVGATYAEEHGFAGAFASVNFHF